VFVTVWTCPVEGPSGVTNQPSIETEITCHPRRRLDAMVRSSTADYDSSDAGGVQACFQVSSNKSTIHSLHDNRLFASLLGLILYAITCLIRRKGRTGTRAFMANVEDRRVFCPKGRQQVGNPGYSVRVVSPLASGLPLVKRALHVDNNKCNHGMLTIPQ